MQGLGSGVFEVALRYKGDAYRVVYALQLGADIWVIHAFQKKSKTGIKTPQVEVDLIRTRLKRLKEMLERLKNLNWSGEVDTSFGILAIPIDIIGNLILNKKISFIFYTLLKHL